MKKSLKNTIFVLTVSLVLFLTLTAETCDNSTSSYQAGQAAKESVLQTATQVVPVPRITNFLERANVAKRAKTMDQPDKLFYLYLFTYGSNQPLGYVVLQGKLSSMSSYLVPQEQVVGNVNSSSTAVVVQDADIDGTYGENQAAVFGYTASGVYFEWNMGYFVSDQPVAVFSVPDMTPKPKK
jgi:hypothetical protein